MIKKDHKIKGAHVLLLGITFKENCPDIRNTKVVDIYREMKEFGVEVDVYDPWADPKAVKAEFGIDLLDKIDKRKSYQAVIAAVSHRQFDAIDFAAYRQQGAVIFDVKGFVDRAYVDARL